MRSALRRIMVVGLAVLWAYGFLACAHGSQDSWPLPEAIMGFGSLQRAQWDPNGRFLATLGSSSVQLWHRNGSLARVLPSPGLTLAGFSWSPDGSKIALANCLGEITILDLSNLTHVTSLAAREPAMGFDVMRWDWPLAWSPDGSLLALCWWDGQTQILDVKKDDLVCVLTGTTSPSGHYLETDMNVEWSPDGSRLLRSGGGSTRIYNLSWREALRLEGDLGTFSPDGSMVAAKCYGGNSCCMVNLYSSTSGAVIRSVNVTATSLPRCLEWSPGGSFLALGTSGGRILVWRWETGEIVSNLSAHGCPVMSLSWTGPSLVSASEDETVKMWSADPGSGTLTYRFSLRGWGGEVGSLSWYPDGKRLLVGRAGYPYQVGAGYGGRIDIYGEDLSVQLEIDLPWGLGGLGAVDVSADGKMIAGIRGTLAGCDVCIWDARFGSLSKVLPLQGELNCLAWCPAQSRLLAVSGPGGVAVWDVEGADEPVLHLPLVGDAVCLAWSPGGRFLAVGLYSDLDALSRVEVWDPWTPVSVASVPVLREYGRRLVSVAWSPDGSKVACLAGFKQRVEEGPLTCSCTGRFYTGTVLVWDVRQGGEGSQTVLDLALTGCGSVENIPPPRDVPLRCLGWAPNSTMLVAGGGVWRLEGGSLVFAANLTGFVRPVSSVSWSPDGSRMAAGDLDGCVRVWRVGPPMAVGEEFPYTLVLVPLALGLVLRRARPRDLRETRRHKLGENMSMRSDVSAI